MDIETDLARAVGILDTVGRGIPGRGIPDRGRLSALLVATFFSMTTVAFISSTLERLVGMMHLATLAFGAANCSAFNFDRPGSKLFLDGAGIDPTVANRCCSNQTKPLHHTMCPSHARIQHFTYTLQ